MDIFVNNVRLYYETFGKGRPLILLHGNGENHHIFSRITKDLSRNHTIYLIDSRCHGKSQKRCSISYDLMASDIISFIHKLRLEKPDLYGFSDGGITGLLIAIKEPGLLSSLIISGANIFPEGMNDKTLKSMKRVYFFTRSKLYRLMLTEPHISPSELEKIEIPVHLLVGEQDLIRREHTELIASHLQNCTLDILPGEDHGSYIIYSRKLLPLIQKYS